MKHQSQKHTVSPAAVEEQARDMRAIFYTLATTDVSRVNPFRDDWQPECPFCTGEMDLDQPLDVSDSLDVTPDGVHSLDGIRHAPRCIVLRARALVELLRSADVTADVRMQEGA